MSRTRRTFGKDFKAKVVLEALKRKRYHRGISKKVRAAAQSSMWKSEAIRNFSAVFSAEKRSLPKMKFQQRNSTLESVS
jgi:hypothetical protein